MTHWRLSHGFSRFFWNVAHRLVREALHDLEFHEFVGQETESPARVARRGWPTGRRDQVHLRMAIDCAGAGGHRAPGVQGGFQSLQDEAFPDPLHRRPAHLDRLGDGLIRPPLVNLQQDPGMGEPSRGPFPRGDQRCQLVSFVSSERHKICLSHTTMIQNHA